MLAAKSSIARRSSPPWKCASVEVALPASPFGEVEQVAPHRREREPRVLVVEVVGDGEGDQVALAGDQPRGEVGVDVRGQRLRRAGVGGVGLDLLQEADLMGQGAPSGQDGEDREEPGHARGQQPEPQQ
jgi:hypothetical protein